MRGFERKILRDRFHRGHVRERREMRTVRTMETFPGRCGRRRGEEEEEEALRGIYERFGQRRGATRQGEMHGKGDRENESGGRFGARREGWDVRSGLRARMDG